MKLYRSPALLPAILLVAGAMPGMAQTHWSVVKTFHVGGTGGWDYVKVDAAHDRFFVTRQTHTLAISETTGQVLGDIPGQIHSHGIALAPKLHRGFITDGGGSGAILIFDTRTYKVLGRIPAMPDSDGMIFDPYMNLVLAVSGDGHALMAFPPDIDPKSGSVGQPIDLGGAPEFLAADASGKAYINIPHQNLVAVVDLHTRKVIARWPVAPGGKPVGMAIDAAKHLLFIGCRGPKKLIVMSTRDGKVEAALPLGKGNDAVRSSHGYGFASCGDGTLTVAGEKDGRYQVVQTLDTVKGGRTMGLDPQRRLIFLPTAQFEPAQPGQRHPGIKPGTFEVVVVGEK